MMPLLTKQVAFTAVSPPWPQRRWFCSSLPPRRCGAWAGHAAEAGGRGYRLGAARGAVGDGHHHARGVKADCLAGAGVGAGHAEERRSPGHCLGAARVAIGDGDHCALVGHAESGRLPTTSQVVAAEQATLKSLWVPRHWPGGGSAQFGHPRLARRAELAAALAPAAGLDQETALTHLAEFTADRPPETRAAP